MKNAVAVCLVVLFIIASAVWAQDVPPPPNRTSGVRTTAPTDYTTRDQTEKAAQKLPEIVSRLGRLESRHQIAYRSHHWGEADKLAAEIRQLKSALKYINENPIGGTPESQQKVIDLLLAYGFVTRGEVGSLLRSEQPVVLPATTTAATPPRKDKGMEIALLAVLGGILAAIVVFGILLVTGRNRRQRAATAADPMTPADAGAWRSNAGADMPTDVPTFAEVVGGSGPAGNWSRFRARWGEAPAPRPNGPVPVNFAIGAVTLASNEDQPAPTEPAPPPTPSVAPTG